mgnify:FL=1
MIELSSNISNYILNLFGNEFLEKYRDFFNGEYKTSIRLSPLYDIEELKNKISAYGIVLENITGIENAFRVSGETQKLGKTLEHTLGRY